MSFFPETRLNVTPIVFYPNGVPTDSTWHDRWLVMLSAAQQKFHTMLRGRDTFNLDQLCLVVKGSLTAAQYKALPHDGVESILAELIEERPFSIYNRYTLPYCLAVLIFDPERAWGGGGGRNFNGKINQGGSILVIPHWHFDDGKLQSTLIHELGHAFGLVHSWERAAMNGLPEDSPIYRCYYGQWTSPSVMSYNLSNHTNSVEAGQIPGCLLGDEIDALSRNKLVFPGLLFDPATDFDCPAVQTGCPSHDGISRTSWLGPMTLVTCSSPGRGDNRKADILNDTPDRYIPSNGSEAWETIKNNLWKSEPAGPGEWITVDVTFPLEVTLDRIIVYSQFGTQGGRVEQIRVAVQADSGEFIRIKHVKAHKADAEVQFISVKAKVWRLAFQGKVAGFVIIRGLRFFHGAKELFPPEGPVARTRSGELFKSQAANLVAVQRTIRANTPQVGFDPETMWHSATLLPAQGWAFLEIAFPEAVTLSRILVYSEHSDQFHAAQQIRVHRVNASEQLTLVKQQSLSQPDAAVMFSEVKAQMWALSFRGQMEGHVVLRGLRFFHGSREWYPPAVVE